jgi:hypothetical protein
MGAVEWSRVRLGKRTYARRMARATRRLKRKLRYYQWCATWGKLRWPRPEAIARAGARFEAGRR